MKIRAGEAGPPKTGCPYTNREKPFNNFARYLGNLIKDGKPLPHDLVPHLVGLQKKLSTFTSHADVGSFVHRVTISQQSDARELRVEYFQYSKTPAERGIHAVTLFHIFVMVLDVFSEFLALEHKIVKAEWQFEIHRLGADLERRAAELRASLPPDFQPDAGGQIP